MKRIPPSEKIRQRINDILENGLETEGDMSSLIIRMGVERLLQEMLEEETKDYLGRGRYERRAPDQAHRGYRNGYELGHIRNGEGKISKCPKCGMYLRSIVPVS